jgi:RNA polymerase sigma-70 factor (ECF subfamily)
MDTRTRETLDDNYPGGNSRLMPLAVSTLSHVDRESRAPQLDRPEPVVAEDDLITLLVLVAEQDRAAFRSLYEKTAGILLRAARRILGDRQLAEDAVQDAFLRIWRRAGTFNPERGGAKAWMGRIVRNASFDRLPKQRDPRRIELIDTIVLPVEPMSGLLTRALETLPSDQRRAIILMYIHGMTHSELSNHLGVPIGTVKSWVRRGSTRLRKSLEAGHPA